MKNKLYNFFLAFILVTLGQVTALASTNGIREVKAYSIKEGPVIDGVLDDAAWEEGEWYSDFRVLGNPDEKASVQTQFKIAFDDQNLYLAARMQEPNPGKLKINEFRHDGLVYMDDAIEFFIDPYGDRKDYYQFVANAAGIKFEAKRSQEGLIHDLEWDNSWEVETSIDGDQWIVEIAIPFVELRLNRQSTKQWTFNVARDRRVDEGELSSFAPMLMHFHELPRFANLEFNDGGDFSRFLWNIRGPYNYAIEAHDSDWIFSGKLKILKNKRVLQKHYKVIFKQVDEKGSRIVSSINGMFKGDDLETEHKYSFPIEKQNPLNLKIELVNSTNPKEVMRVEKATLPVKYKPLEVTVQSPAYRNKIYPTEKLSQIRVNVKLVISKELAKGTQLKMFLVYKRTGEVVSEYLAKEFKSDQEYILPVSELLVGSYTLEVQLLRENGDIIYSQQEDIRKLRPTENEWRFQEHILYHNGKPFIPFGKFDASVGFVKESNLPESSIYMTKGLNNADMYAYLDLVDEKKSFAIISPLIDRDYGFMMNRSGNALTKEEKDDIRKRVQIFKSHPALMGWCVAYYPEIDNIAPKRMKEIYELIAGEDPFHPCIIVTSATGGLVQYVDACDVVIPTAKFAFTESGASRPIEYVSMMMDHSTKVMRGQKATWAGFNAVSYIKDSEQQLRIPTLIELRNMLYQSVLEGVHGYFWLEAFSGNVSPQIALGLPFLRGEIVLLDEVINAKNSRQNRVVTTNTAIKSAVKEVNGHYYIIAVNKEPRAQKTKLSADFLKNYEDLRVISEGRKLPLGGRRFIEDDFKPYDVHIYTTNLASEGEESIHHVLEAIDLTQI